MSSTPEDQFIASAHSVSHDGVSYAQTIRLGRHTIVADEPEVQGGKDAGAAPYALVLSGLAACTAITLAMYAQRKNWSIGEVKVDLRMFRTGDEERIERTITVATVTEEQRARLAEIAEKTPVTKTMKRSMTIPTTVKTG